MKLSLKFFIITIVSCAMIWVVAFNIRSYFIDKEVSEMRMNENYVEEVFVSEPESITVHIDGTDYEIQELAGVGLTAGDIVDVTVVYDNDEVVNTKAYVTYSTDLSDYVVRYDSNVEGSNYGRIVLPNEEGK